MSEVLNYTDEQKQAIGTPDKNILVSASAGSGKTTIMIERVLKLMLGEPKVPISNFLVVTFTKASAADMKKKLVDKLLSIESKDEFVLNQIESVDTSDITNLHSFCSKLVSVYFYKAQIDASFKVLDEVDATLLKNKAIEKLFNEKEKTGDLEYFMLFDMFQKKRNLTQLKEIIFRIDSFINSILNGEAWLRDKVNEMHNVNLDKNECANLINNYVCSRICEDSSLAEEFANRCLKVGCDKYYNHFIDISEKLKVINKSKSYITNAKNIFELSLGKRPTVKDEFKFLSSEAKIVNDTIKHNLENYRENYCSDDLDVLTDGLKFGKQVLTNLLNIVAEFDEIYSKAKKEVNGLDFNDLEKYALMILSDEVTLNAVREKYKYVFVDEYQDINEVQEKIISLLSGKNNRFMVGDIKQSIYRFRFCDSDIFLNTYKNYQNGNDNNLAIKLNCNFRSDKKILKFVDLVFSGIMTEKFGGIDYKNDSCFVPNEKNVDLPGSVNLCYIDTEKTKSEPELNEGIYSVKNHIQSDTDEIKASVAEAVYVAGKIAELTSIDNPNRIEYKDIAILVQSRNTAVSKFLDTLSVLGIPVSSDEKSDLLSKPYIDEIISFVKFCVNHNDDFLCYKILKSHMFNFSDNELSEIRKIDMKVRFYECLKNCENIKDESLKLKLLNFNNKMEKFYELSKLIKIKDFIRQILDDFDLKQIWLSNANGKQIITEIDDFVRVIPDVYAVEFVTGYENFSLEIQNEIDDKCVKCMSIHASKGIEFNTVFLINTAKKFSMKSLFSDLLLSKQFGMGVNYFDTNNRVKYDSVVRSAISITEKRKLVEESQRLLYVALTRAKEKLFVVCSKNKSALQSKFPARPNSFINWFEWIIFNELQNVHNDIINFETFKLSDLEFNGKKEKRELLLSTELEKDIQKDFEYQYKTQVNIPLKNSVSKIIEQKESLKFDENTLDEFDDEFENFERITNDEILNSSAKRGTCYHKIFEKLDLKNVQEIKNKLRIIIDENLAEDEKELVNVNNIIQILDLPFFKNINNDDIILKEREFYAKMPAKIISSDAGIDDSFILQGVVDLVIIRNNELIILDYKTGKINPGKLEKYNFQINLYADAISRAFNLPVQKKYLCFIDECKILEI